MFFAAVNTGFVSNGKPDSRFLEFYEKRSSPQLYCSIVGNIVVPGGYGSNASTPEITHDTVWSDVASRIAIRGALPGIQLASTWKGYEGSRKFVAKTPDAAIDAGRQLVSDLGRAGILDVIASFRSGALLAVNHGFRHVQLHAAHGYLLSLLIDSRINPLAHSVIGDLDSLALELRDKGVETSIRISLKTGNAQFDSLGAGEFHDRLCQTNFDFIDISSGFYNIDKRLIYPSRPEFLAMRKKESLEVAARHPEKQFIFTGRVAKMGYADLPLNMHPGFCRDLIANPDFLRDKENGCENHGKCHYFSRGEIHITCGRW